MPAKNELSKPQTRLQRPYFRKVHDMQHFERAAHINGVYFDALKRKATLWFSSSPFWHFSPSSIA